MNRENVEEYKRGIESKINLKIGEEVLLKALKLLRQNAVGRSANDYNRANDKCY